MSITGQEHDAYSLFGELNYYFNDELSLIVGGRYTKEKKDFYQQPFGQYPNTGPRIDQDDSWSDFGPKLGLRYLINSNLMSYVTYQKGFKGGGFNGRCGQPATCLQSFDPETVDGFELGLKGEFFNNRLRSNIALFWNEFSDLQRTVAVPLIGADNPHETITQNAGSATIKGIELELSALLTDSLRIDLGVGFLDTSYDEFCADLNGATPYLSQPVSECGTVTQASNLDDPGGPATYLVGDWLTSGGRRWGCNYG